MELIKQAARLYRQASSATYGEDFSRYMDQMISVTAHYAAQNNVTISEAENIIDDYIEKDKL